MRRSHQAFYFHFIFSSLDILFWTDNFNFRRSINTTWNSEKRFKLFIYNETARIPCRLTSNRIWSSDWKRFWCFFVSSSKLLFEFNSLSFVFPSHLNFSLKIYLVNSFCDQKFYRRYVTSWLPFVTSKWLFNLNCYLLFTVIQRTDVNSMNYNLIIILEILFHLFKNYGFGADRFVSIKDYHLKIISSNGENMKIHVFLAN